MSELYPWLKPMWQEWQANLEADRFANAVLLTSAPGMGASQLVAHFARAVMCQNYPAEACGFCHSCQLMSSDSHPDYHLIQAEQQGKAITVEQIRQCNRIAQESSQLSGTRLFVISPAEAMNESAANALLKTLEEPAANCLFLLVSHHANMLLPTITSRCQQWHLGAPEPESVIAWLTQQVGQQIPAYALHLNAHAPLATLEFIRQDKASRYLSLESALLACWHNPAEITQLAKSLAEAPLESLNWLWYLLIDAQKVHYGLATPYLTPGAAKLAQLAGYTHLDNQAKTLVKLIDKFRRHSGLNAELLILDWLFNVLNLIDKTNSEVI